MAPSNKLVSKGAMFSSFQPTAALTAAADLLPTHATWSSEPEDVAFGCECADPALQIASWGQEAAQGSQAGLPAA